MEVSNNRSIAELTHRVTRLEESISALSYTEANAPTLSDSRANVDLMEAPISAELVGGNPLLASLYSSENSDLDKFCIGTWPDAEATPRSVAIHGGTASPTGDPIEFTRMVVYPHLISAGIPFSAISFDGNTGVPVDSIKNIVDEAASHMVVMTPGSPNYKEYITRAYLAGRGNTNVHVITHNTTPLGVPSDDGSPNLIGISDNTSTRNRVMESEDLLMIMSPMGTVRMYTGFQGDTGFDQVVIKGAPDELGKTKQSSVQDRRDRFARALSRPRNTDMGELM